MFEKFSRSWQLVKASATVLKQDKALLVFPAVSTVAALLVAATFIIPMLMAAPLSEVFSEEAGVPAWFYIWMFVFYVIQYFVMFFFNSALVGAAMIRLEGGQPTIAKGLQIALSRIGAIFTYAVIAATVGLILRALEQRAGFIGRMVVGFVGLAWTVASFLVVPILVTRDVNAIDAVKESAGLLKRTWGENLIGQAGLGLVFGLIQFVLVMLAIGLVVGGAAIGGAPLAIAGGICGFVAVIAAALIQAALSGIYSAALYRFATGQRNPDVFQNAMLENAFANKG